MVLLNMTTNTNSTIIANFESLYDETFINFQNNKSCIFAAGILNNSFKIYDKNNLNDYGVSYDNNTLSTRNINALSFKNNSYTVFPNPYTETYLYNISAIEGYNLVNSPSECFTMDTSTFWMSRQIYSITPQNQDTNGTVLVQRESYKFNNLDSACGERITITFPYKVIPLGFTINSVGKKYDPKRMIVFVSNDNITWTNEFEGLIRSEINQFINYYSEYNKFYKYITFVITQVTVDDPGVASSIHFIINNLIIYTKPVLFLDNDIKITNDNIYNVKSINVKQLYINDSNISSIGDIANTAIQSSIDIIIKNNSFYWKTSVEKTDYNGLKYNFGYYDTNVIKKLMIGAENQYDDAAAMLDVKRDICYNNKILKKFIKIQINQIFQTGVDIQFNSSYIEIGNIKILSVNDNFYFELKLYSYDIDVYYFQTITIYGNVKITLINGIYTINNIYWKTSYNNSFAIQRIINIKYYYNDNTKIIKFYALFNDNLNLTRTLETIIPFKNLIFFDGFHTNNITTFDFPDITISLSVTSVSVNYLSEAILINKTILNNNSTYTTSNIINNLFANNLTITNSSITKQNVLMLDSNANIVDTGISSNIFSGLKIANYYANSIVGTDNRGILQSLQIPNNLLSNLNNISSLGSSAKIVTSLQESVTITQQQ